MERRIYNIYKVFYRWDFMKLLKRVIKDMYYRFKDDDVIALSSQLSYSFITAFFPFLIFLLSITAFTNVNTEVVLENLKVILPNDAYNLIDKIVVEVLGTRSGNLLSLSLLSALISAASGIMGVIRGLNKAYDEPEKRGMIKVWLISVLGTVGITITVTLSLIFLIFGGLLGNYLQCCYRLADIYRAIWDILRLIISILILVMIFTAIYYYLPSRRLRWREVVPGAVFSSAGWLISSILFSLYVNNFSNYSKFYGSLGAVFMIMTWLYMSSVMIIMGGELNASLVFNRMEKEKSKVE
jgi:membrane protein